MVIDFLIHFVKAILCIRIHPWICSLRHLILFVLDINIYLFIFMEILYKASRNWIKQLFFFLIFVLEKCDSNILVKKNIIISVGSFLQHSFTLWNEIHWHCLNEYIQISWILQDWRLVQFKSHSKITSYFCYLNYCIFICNKINSQLLLEFYITCVFKNICIF